MSITQEQFDGLKKMFGKVSSFAVWRMPDPGDKSTAYIDDLTEIRAGNVHNRAVFVGLNPSRSLLNKPDFANFHDADSRGHDYSLRRAVENSPYRGSFMIDIIPDFENPDSAAAMKRIKADRAYYKKCMEKLMEALHWLTGSSKRKPVLVAMGAQAYSLLTDSYDTRFNGECDLCKRGYPVFQISHYAASVSDERKKLEIRNLPTLFADCDDVSELLHSYHLGTLKSEMLTQESAVQMIQELQNADAGTCQQIVNRLIAASLPRIEAEAKNFSGHGAEEHLLLLAGIKGLVCAAEHYNCGTDRAFESYALWHIRQYMRKLNAEKHQKNLQTEVQDEGQWQKICAADL